MEVDRNVETESAQLAYKPEVVCDSSESARAWRHDDLVQVRIVTNDRRCVCFDQIDETRRRVFTPQGAHERRREYHVADEPQTQ